jgi:hypothetical protein
MVQEINDKHLKYHFCDKHEGWMEYDLQGIPINFVCEVCRDAKLEGYRNFLKKCREENDGRNGTKDATHQGGNDSERFSQTAWIHEQG